MAWRAPALSSHKSRDQHKTSVLRLIDSISCGFEDVEAFFTGEEIADVTDSGPEGVVSAGGSLSDQRLELRECHLNHWQAGYYVAMSRVWTPPGLQVISFALAQAMRSSSFVYPASGCDLQRRGPSW